MQDISQLSDEQLMQMANQMPSQQPAQSQHSQSLDSLSDEQLQAMLEQQQQTSAGIMENLGPTIRGAGPYIAGGLAGLALAPEAAAAATAFGVGMGLMGLTKMVGDPLITGINRIANTSMATPSEAFDELFTRVGVPKSRTELAKMIEAASAAGMDLIGTGIVAPIIAAGKGKTAENVAKLMATESPENIISGAASGALGEGSRYVVEQLGGGELAQALGSVAGGVLGAGAASAAYNVPQVFNREARLQKAAIEARNSVMQMLANNPEEAAARIKMSAEELSRSGVQLTPADISGDEGLIGLQQARRNTSQAIRARDVENLAKISENIDKPMQPVGAPSEEATKFFDAHTQSLLDQADLTYTSLMNEGRAAEAKTIAEAEAQVAANKKLLAQGEVSLNEALARNQIALAEAQAKVSDLALGRAAASAIIKDILEGNEAITKQKAQELFSPIKIGNVESDFKNTVDAAIKARNQISIAGDVPDRIKKILSRYVDKEGNAIPQNAEQLVLLDSDLSSDIRALREKGESKAVMLLGKIRDGIDADLQKLGDVHPQLKEARKAWRDYSEKYTNGVSGKVLKQEGRIDDPRIIESFMNSGVNEATRLRSALLNNEEGLKAVSAWVINKLDQDFANKQTLTPQRLSAWMNKDLHKEWFSVFPEAKQAVDELAANIVLRSNQVEKSLLDLKNYKSTEIDESLVSAAKLKAKQEFAALKEGAKTTIADFQKQIADSAAKRFVGPDPADAIGLILNSTSKDAQFQMHKLLETAALDSTGHALQGVKNALREYINPEIRQTGKVTSTGNVVKPVEAKDLAASLSRMNTLMMEGSPSRKAIELVFGKNSAEMNALDLARKQIEVISRRQRGSAGQSNTSLNQAMEASYDYALQNNAIDLIHRISTGMHAADFRRMGAPSWITAAADSAQKLWKGDVRSRALYFLDRALLDPELAIEALRPMTKENAGFIRQLLGWTGIQAVKGIKSQLTLPFTPGKVNSEKLGDGMMVKDLNYGFQAVSKNGKVFRLFDPSGKSIAVGSLEEVRNVAIRESKALKTK